MSGIITFFQDIAGLIVSIVQFFIDAVQGAIHVAEMIPSYIAFAYDMFACLPGFLKAFIVLAFAIMLIWFVRSLI